jgi:hypothetical protein
VLFMGLSLARDEFLWLLRHNDNPPLKGKNSKQLEEFYTDRYAACAATRLLLIPNFFSLLPPIFLLLLLFVSYSIFVLFVFTDKFLS